MAKKNVEIKFSLLAAHRIKIPVAHWTVLLMISEGGYIETTVSQDEMERLMQMVLPPMPTLVEAGIKEYVEVPGTKGLSTCDVIAKWSLGKRSEYHAD